MSTIITRCNCGAKYKLDAALGGHRVKCKKCGEVFEIPGGAKPAPTSAALKPATRKPVDKAAMPATPVQPVSAPPLAAAAVATPPGALGYAPVAEGESPAAQGRLGFLRALLNAFLFFRRIGNVGTFFVAWLTLAAGNIGGGWLLSSGYLPAMFLGFVVALLAEGSFAAFSFDTIRQAAEGEDELPTYPLALGPEDWWELLVKPFFAFLGISVLVLVPAVIYSSAISASAASGTAGGALAQLLGVGGLMVLGLFLWPMLILCVTVGGSDTLLHVGRIVPAIFRTIGPYACTALTVYLCAAACIVISSYLNQSNLPGIVLTVIAYGLRVFLQTGAMRAVGAYYHCHYEKLAWMLD